MKQIHPTQPVLAEQLEARQLLAATLDGSLLKVDGTGKGDNIVVSKDPKNTANILVRLGKKQNFRFKATKVKSLSINGLGGNDRITLNDKPGQLRLPVTVNGGDGNDSIIGSKARDLILGGNGNDTLFGGDGNDDLRAGGGNDIIFAGRGNDRVRGEGGHDLMYGDEGNDNLIGDTGNDTLGGDDEDILTTNGNQNNDVVGNDVLNGGKGNDWLLGGTRNGSTSLDNNGQDTLIGGPGADILDARDGGGDDLVKDKGKGDFVPVEDAPRAREAPGDVHTHVALIIRVRQGKKMRAMHIPANIGIVNFTSHLHTHRASSETLETGKPPGSAVIHFESPSHSSYSLKEFFALWGISFSSNHIGRFHNIGKHKVKVTVQPSKGEAFSTKQFENYRPKNAEIVTITLG